MFHADSERRYATRCFTLPRICHTLRMPRIAYAPPFMPIAAAAASLPMLRPLLMRHARAVAEARRRCLI